MTSGRINTDLGRYAEQGHCLIRGGADAATLEGLRAGIQSVIDTMRLGPETQSTKYRDFAVGLHVKSEAVAEYLRGEVFRRIVRGVLGGEADLRFTSTITKTAERGHGVDWHQDLVYEKEPGHENFICWIAVTESNRGNGCLRVIPGSHAAGLVEHITSRAYPPDKEIAVVDESRGVDVEMAPGDILVLHPLIQHASGHNVSGKTRMSLIAGFQRPKHAYMEFELKVSYAYLRGGESRWERVNNLEKESP